MFANNEAGDREPSGRSDQTTCLVTSLLRFGQKI